MYAFSRCLCLALLAGTAVPASAQMLRADVAASAGGVMADATYQLSSTLGESSLGRAENASYALSAGFWSVYVTSIIEPVSEEDGPAELPQTFALHAAYPNPAASSATLRYDMPESGPVRLVAFDVLGREVTVLLDADRAAGRHSATLDAAGLPSGLYFVRMTASGFAHTSRLTVLH